MKSNIKTLLIAIISIAIGIGLGYFIFGNQQADMSQMSEHQHESTTVPSSTKEEVWTCSMHPQIRQNEPGICPICEMDLIPLEANTSNDPLVLQMNEASVKLANIQTTTVGAQGQQSGKNIRLSGKVQVDERLASSQVAHVPGRIEKLFVTFTGEQVNEGQQLATLYSPELITAQRELLEALKLQDLNPKLVEAARNKLRFWKIGDATIQAIEQEGVIRETFTLYAAQSGVVAKRRVAVGDYVKKGDPLFDLMNLSKVWVLFDAYEEDLSSISVGDQIEFSTPSISNKTFKTHITFVDPMIHPQTRVAALRTEVNNSNRLLKPEMFVNGHLQNKRMASSKLTVPKSAVLWTGKRSVVYVQLPDMEIPSFQFREVELGEALGDRYQLISGLKAGEEVVTYGSFTIDAAAQLNNQASMMNKEVSLKKEGIEIRPNYRAATPKMFQQQLNQVTNEYLELKDALVATDTEAAKISAQKLMEQLDKVDMSLLKGEAHLYWMEQLNALQSHGKKITELKEDIEGKRSQFGFLSQALINAIDAFGIDREVIYVQHCPMAFDNEGGDWLAMEKAIQNPYFGDKMMKCGLVKKEFLSAQ